MVHTQIPGIKKLKGLPKVGDGNLSKIEKALQILAHFRPKNEAVDCRAAFHKIRAFAYERSVPRPHKWKTHQHDILAMVLPEDWARILPAMKLYILSDITTQERDACHLLLAKLYRLKQKRDMFVNSGGVDGQETKG